MTTYLLNNPIEQGIFKSFIFQILYTIYQIKKLYPSFQHYDLHSDNIMLKIDTNYIFNPMKPEYNVYWVEDKRFAIPYVGMMPKIIDFGFAVIAEKGIVSNIIDDKDIMFKRTKNDLVMLYYHIYDVAHDDNIIVDMLKALEPNETYKHFNTEYIRSIEDKIPSYTQMIDNSIWNDYTNFEVNPSFVINEYNNPNKKYTQKKK
jgi:serine/threonine protein kinase